MPTHILTKRNERGEEENIWGDRHQLERKGVCEEIDDGWVAKNKDVCIVVERDVIVVTDVPAL